MLGFEMAESDGVIYINPHKVIAAWEASDESCHVLFEGRDVPFLVGSPADRVAMAVSDAL